MFLKGWGCWGGKVEGDGRGGEGLEGIGREVGDRESECVVKENNSHSTELN